VADEDLGAGFVTITLEDRPAIDAADKLAEKLARALDRGARIAGQRIERAITRAIRQVSPATIEIEADLTAFEIALRKIKLPGPLEIVVIPKVNAAQWRRDIIAQTAGIQIPIRVVPDVSGFDRRIREMRNPTIRADVDANVNTARLKSALGALSSAFATTGKALTGLLGFGALGIAAASATTSIVNLTAALAPAAGILAAGPAVVLGFAAALGTLKLAFSGVGDAFGAALTGDAKAFEKSLDKLSPKAKAAAREVRALKPAFDDLRSSVQDSFFAPLQGEITGVAKALGGTLKGGLTGISTQFGLAATQVLRFLQSAQPIANIGDILSGTTDALDGLGQAAQDVISGFLAIGASVSKAFGSQVSSGIQTVAAKLGGFLTDAANSGKAVAWVDNALTVFAQLGSIISNVGHILFAVFQAGQTAGGGLLNNLMEITGQVRDFVESTQGAAAIQQIFATIATVAKQLGPIIAAVATQLGALAPKLVPIFTALGPAIVSAVNAIGPALQALAPAVATVAQALGQAINQLADSGVLTSIASAIGSIATAIAPVLPLAAQLIGTLGAALTPILNALAPVLGTVVTAIGALVGAISPILVIAGQLIAQLGPILTPIIATLAQTFTALAPVIQTVGNILSSVLGPILGVLPTLLQPILDAFNALVGALLPPLNALLLALQPSLSQLTDAIVQVATALAPVLAQFGLLAAQLLDKLMPLITPLIGLIGELAAILAGRLAQQLTTVVVPALNAVAALLKGDFSGAFRSMGEVVKNQLKLVFDLFTELPLKILQAVGKFGILLEDAGVDLIQGLINGVKSMGGALGGAIKDLAKGAVDAAKSFLGIHSPSTVFATIGQQVGQGFVNGIDSMAGASEMASRTLASAALSPFAGVTSPTVGTASVTGAQQLAAQSAQGTRVRRSGVAQSVPAGGPAIVNNFTINEVASADVTAQRVINRMVTDAGVFLLD
jgi:phage-related protein